MAELLAHEGVKATLPLFTSLLLNANAGLCMHGHMSAQHQTNLSRWAPQVLSLDVSTSSRAPCTTSSDEMKERRRRRRNMHMKRRAGRRGRKGKENEEGGIDRGKEMGKESEDKGGGQVGVEGRVGGVRRRKGRRGEGMGWKEEAEEEGGGRKEKGKKERGGKEAGESRKKEEEEEEGGGGASRRSSKGGG